MQSSEISSIIYKKLLENGLTENLAEMTTTGILLLSYILISIFLFWISRKIIIGFFTRVSRKTKSTFDDILLSHRTPKLLSYFPSLYLLHKLVPELLTSYQWLENVFEAISVIVAIALTRALLKSLNDYLKTLRTFKDKPIDSYIQVIMIFLWFIGGIINLSVLTGTEV